ncbi:hypothetical protein [Paraburkholderia terrae]|uniref:hypothetical protein n=1 Tax=Paraburkholderia terrae TaxID=311230 RepID=UPI0012DFFAB5|nr:hypothetical protein [Paraburkholderia terrae]
MLLEESKVRAGSTASGAARPMVTAAAFRCLLAGKGVKYRGAQCLDTGQKSIRGFINYLLTDLNWLEMG